MPKNLTVRLALKSVFMMYLASQVGIALAAPAQQLSQAPVVSKAHRCEVVVNVEWNKHDANFSQKAEFSEVFAAVSSSGLYQRYTETSADHADLILKVDDNALVGRVTLEVLNPDDNSVVYSESRDRVAVDNDVKRLIEHFLGAVDDALTVSPKLLGLYGSVGGCEGSAFLYDSAALTGTPVALVTPGTVLRVWPSSVGGSYAAQMEDFQSETVIHSGFVSGNCLSKTWPAPLDNQPAAQDTGASPAGPAYLWLGRFDQEEKAQDISKKIEALGLPVSVLPRHSSDGDFFLVVTGPYGPERIEQAMDWLKTQGFSGVRVVKKLPAAGSREPD